MSNFVHIITEDSVIIIDSSNGETAKFFKGDDRYTRSIELIKEGRPQDTFTLDAKQAIQTAFNAGSGEFNDDFGEITIKLRDGLGYVTLHQHNDMEVPLHEAITRRIVKMVEQGFDVTPIINFITNLYDNPSSSAVNELFLFIEKCELPITSDGCFIAYKIVRNNYMDNYSGTIRNMVGDRPSMPRSMVDPNRHNTCSMGLHFCSRGYLKHFGGSGDRCMLVKVNPADVVSIPSDYNNAKGRTWLYEVVGEVEGNWHDWLYDRDYTTKAVVTEKGKEAEVPALPQKPESADYSVDFKRGYADGYKDGRNNEPFADRSTANDVTVADKEYNDGFDIGYKHGKAHKAKLIKS